ncbi:Nuclear nucleic acid-binding protein [Yarrowia sp. B02]|nr:Nuclear nucleic acid-binding protein [Yarrowia sp. B02]
MADHIEDVLELSHTLQDVTSELSQQIKMIDFKAVAELPPLEQAQFYSKLAYVTNSAMFAFILASGADPKTHPIMKDLETVKTYMGKVAHAEGKPGPARKDERNTKVDIPAAKRIIFAQTEKPQPAISSDSFKEPKTTSDAAEAFLKDVTKSASKDKKEKKEKKEKKDKKTDEKPAKGAKKDKAKVTKPKKGKKD